MSIHTHPISFSLSATFLTDNALLNFVERATNFNNRYVQLVMKEGKPDWQECTAWKPWQHVVHVILQVIALPFSLLAFAAKCCLRHRVLAAANSPSERPPSGGEGDPGPIEAKRVNSGRVEDAGPPSVLSRVVEETKGEEEETSPSSPARVPISPSRVPVGGVGEDSATLIPPPAPSPERVPISPLRVPVGGVGGEGSTTFNPQSPSLLPEKLIGEEESVDQAEEDQAEEDQEEREQSQLTSMSPTTLPLSSPSHKDFPKRPRSLSQSSGFFSGSFSFSRRNSQGSNSQGRSYQLRINSPTRVSEIETNQDFTKKPKNGTGIDKALGKWVGEKGLTEEEQLGRKKAKERIYLNRGVYIGRGKESVILDLSGLSLTTLPECLEGFFWVEQLDIRGNGFKKLPDPLLEKMKGLKAVSVDSFFPDQEGVR